MAMTKNERDGKARQVASLVALTTAQNAGESRNARERAVALFVQYDLRVSEVLPYCNDRARDVVHRILKDPVAEKKTTQSRTKQGPEPFNQYGANPGVSFDDLFDAFTSANSTFTNATDGFTWNKQANPYTQPAASRVETTAEYEERLRGFIHQMLLLGYDMAAIDRAWRQQGNGPIGGASGRPGPSYKDSAGNVHVVSEMWTGDIDTAIALYETRLKIEIDTCRSYVVDAMKATKPDFPRAHLELEKMQRLIRDGVDDATYRALVAERDRRRSSSWYPGKSR